MVGKNEEQSEHAMGEHSSETWKFCQALTEDEDCVRIVASEESFPQQSSHAPDARAGIRLDRWENMERDDDFSVACSENIFEFDETVYEVDFLKIAPRSPAGFDQNQHLHLKVVTNVADMPVFKLDKFPDKCLSMSSSLDFSTRRLDESFRSDLDPGCNQENENENEEEMVRNRAIEEYLSMCYSMRTAPITKLVQNLNSLHRIDLKSRGMGNRGCTALASFVRKNRFLKVLHLEDNNLGLEGLSAMSNAIVESNSLRELYLNSNNLGEAIQCLFPCLKSEESCIEVLDLGDCKLDDKGAQLLSKCLKGNASIRILGLKSNSISDQAAVSLIDALATLNTLEELDLTWNSIRNGDLLVKLLQTNKSLTTLRLAWNRIGSAGAKALALALRLGCSLQSLDLSKNDIGFDACEGFARTLAMKPKLLDLNLNGNPIGMEGALLLLSGIMPDSPLRSIHFADCGVGSKGKIPVLAVQSGGGSVDELRTLCPELLGTLKPIAVKKSIQSASKPFRQKEWVSTKPLAVAYVR